MGDNQEVGEDMKFTTDADTTMHEQAREATHELIWKYPGTANTVH